MTKILIVEDDLIISRIHRTTLVSGGYAVETASDGFKALEKLEEFKPDLVLLDLMMPNMDGVEVIKRIRANETFKAIPIVVASNFYLSDLVQKAWKAGANNCIMKIECSRTELLNIIKKALAKEGPTPILKSALAASQNPDGTARNGETDTQRTKNQRLLRTDLEAVRKASQAFINREQDRSSSGPELISALKNFNTRATSNSFKEMADFTQQLSELIQEIMGDSGTVRRGNLSTIAQGVDALSILLERAQLSLSSAGNKPQVLVIDDDPIGSQILGYALEKANLAVTGVRNPTRALAVLEEKQYNLIILEIELPRMPGFEVCARIRKIPSYAKTPVWLIAREENAAQRAKAISSGANEFLVKPLMVKEVTIKALSSLLKKEDVMAQANNTLLSTT